MTHTVRKPKTEMLRTYLNGTALDNTLTESCEHPSMTASDAPSTGADTSEFKVAAPPVQNQAGHDLRLIY